MTVDALKKLNSTDNRKTKISEIDDEKHKELEEEEDMLSLNEKLSSERSPFIVFPDSRFRAIWDLVAFMLILYQSIMLPLKLSFNTTFSESIIYFDMV